MKTPIETTVHTMTQAELKTLIEREAFKLLQQCINANNIELSNFRKNDSLFDGK